VRRDKRLISITKIPLTQHPFGRHFTSSFFPRRFKYYEKPSSYKSMGERSREKKSMGRGGGSPHGGGHPDIVLLTNEGTASSAEVFAAALRDNGEAKIVGSRTFGKGLIQHIFPLSDNGEGNVGMVKATVGEYLTPKLQHVTNVGGAKVNGAGVKADVFCRSEGIPLEKQGDLCVQIALDELGD
jgi:C-terminal processing protease CtpA/Prc